MEATRLGVLKESGVHPAPSGSARLMIARRVVRHHPEQSVEELPSCFARSDRANLATRCASAFAPSLQPEVARECIGNPPARGSVVQPARAAWENFGNLFVDSTGRRGTLYLDISVEHLNQLLAGATEGRAKKKIAIFAVQPKDRVGAA